MAMRLLKKDEIDQAKTRDRKMEIDEGIKLAKRVDNLRETAVEEEASLEKYRKETVQRIYEETKKAAEERDIVIRERDAARDERDELLKPLTAEWEQLQVAKDELENQERLLYDKEYLLESEKKDVEKSLANSKVIELQAKSQLEEAVQERKETADDLKNAKKQKSIAKKIKEDAEKLHKEALEDIDMRYNELAKKESEIQDKEQWLDLTEKELAKTKILLEDRIRMAERTINRNKIKK